MFGSSLSLSNVVLSSGPESGRLVKELGHDSDQLPWRVHVYVVARLVEYLELGIGQPLRDLVPQLAADETIVFAP